MISDKRHSVYYFLDADDADNADLKGCAIKKIKKDPRHPCHPRLKDYLSFSS